MRLFFILFTSLFYFSVFAQPIHITPQPASIAVLNGTYPLKTGVKLIADKHNTKAASFINDYLKTNYGFQLPISNNLQENGIKFISQTLAAPLQKGYTLVVNQKGVTITGQNEGLLNGAVSFLQLLPVNGPVINSQIPFCKIEDYPRFQYRGMHLDVSRHYFPISFIKKYIDYLAFYKFNYFHWHLTDDQGWRIEIKKYPLLTEIGAWRNGTIVGRYPGKGNDQQKHGGVYTQAEVKEIVKYADSRNIVVIPEIELPGHAGAAIAAYPNLSCFPDLPTKNYFPKKSTWYGDSTGKQVEQAWGVFEDVFCAGKENTFQFLQDVLNEVIPLFPAKYIHIGGDECPKENWKKCSLCQQRMQAHHLKDEHELQSYFIQRIEKYLNQKGKTIIGWDEILEGGLAPNAIVMSWRGEKGGIEAAKLNHQVIMTPGTPVYFDYSQTKNDDSITIGGHNSLQAVYNYEPVPASLPKDKVKYIWGAQANVWTEYIKYPSKVEYMIFPRMSALSEVLWSKKENKNWDNFLIKLMKQFSLYDLWKASYSTAYFDISAATVPNSNLSGVSWQLATTVPNATIQWKKENETFQDYKQPINITQSGHYYATVFVNNKETKNDVAQWFSFSKLTGKKINLAQKASLKYPGDGAFTLVNGIINTKGLAVSNDFLGFEGGDNCEAIIDCSNTQNISRIIVHTLDLNGSWIYPPKEIEVLTSSDNKTFQSLGKATQFTPTGSNGNGTITLALDKPITTKYIQVKIVNYGKIPDGLPGSGEKAWLFVDEIEVQ